MDETDARSSTFGKLLLEHRRAAGLSQADLSRASGISVRALRDLERGRAQAAQQRSAEVLADALELTGSERELFLTIAKEGRRRTPRPAGPTALCALPPMVPDLVGRESELDQVRPPADERGAVIAIVGQPGVGKTALAIAAAHRLKDDYPDGCFAVDLRGMDERPLSARATLDRLLRALGVAPGQIPLAEAEQSNLFRMLLEGRRVLILLDNASDESQVRPLLATTPGCLTLITCRRALAGLESARWVWLESLADSDAVSLLATIVGATRVDAEPEAARELVALCGNLPLAVRIAGNRLATRPHWSLDYLVALLRNERTRLNSLSAGDLQMRSAFEISYRRLSPPAQILFRRLAALPGADFGARLAGVCAGMPEPDLTACLDELVDTSLLQTASPAGRFQFHDLIRLFAVERWEAEEKPDDRERRYYAVLDHVLGTATAAGRVFFPDAVSTAPFASREEAADWLEEERTNWLAAQREAARLGHHREVLDLARAMHWYSDGYWLQGPWDEVFRLGAEAARALDSRDELAVMLNFLGWAQQVCLEDNETALATHREALAVATEVGELREQAWAHGYLGSVLLRLGRPEEALGHAQQSCELGEEFPFWSMRLSLHNRLGRVQQALGRHEEALSTHRDLLAETAEHADEAPVEVRRWMSAVVTREIGGALSGLGEYRRAAETFREARLVFRECGMPGMEGSALLAEAAAWRQAGETARARECLDLALELPNVVARAWQEQVRAEMAFLPED
ncbi:ATP-binding protein [Amycolatopsis pigmentata]|uniref:ATP-binding protein n=1 Tax=Amycolatopsis pigmentata TaxID=450801 RepID=A0ABW5G064_9PSEU